MPVVLTHCGQCDRVQCLVSGADTICLWCSPTVGSVTGCSAWCPGRHHVPVVLTHCGQCDRVQCLVSEADTMCPWYSPTVGSVTGCSAWCPGQTPFACGAHPLWAV